MRDPNEQMHSMIEGSWKARALSAEARARRAESERDRYRRALERISDECEPDSGASDTLFLIARAQAVARARAALDGKDS